MGDSVTRFLRAFSLVWLVDRAAAHMHAANTFADEYKGMHFSGLPAGLQHTYREMVREVVIGLVRGLLQTSHWPR